MNAGGETADQAVRMTLQGIEMAANVALKAGGMASKSLAVTLYAILTDKKKVKGKTRLANMLKSGKELKVFAVHHSDLKKFCEEAKRYGVLYSVLKERNNTDGICDIMVRAEDAAKISRIVDKYELATIDTEAMRKAALTKQPDEFKDVKPLTEKEHDELVSSLLNSMKEEQNPSMARTKMRGENQFEHISMEEGINKRPSVKKELDEIKNRNKKSKPKQTVRQRNRVRHKQPQRKKKIKRKVR